MKEFRARDADRREGDAEDVAAATFSREAGRGLLTDGARTGLALDVGPLGKPWDDLEAVGLLAPDVVRLREPLRSSAEAAPSACTVPPFPSNVVQTARTSDLALASRCSNSARLLSAKASTSDTIRCRSWESSFEVAMAKDANAGWDGEKGWGRKRGSGREGRSCDVDDSGGSESAVEGEKNCAGDSDDGSPVVGPGSARRNTLESLSESG